MISRVDDKMLSYLEINQKVKYITAIVFLEGSFCFCCPLISLKIEPICMHRGGAEEPNLDLSAYLGAMPSPRKPSPKADEFGRPSSLHEKEQRNKDDDVFFFFPPQGNSKSRLLQPLRFSNA